MKLTRSEDFMSTRLLSDEPDPYHPPLWRAMPAAVLSGDDNGRIVRYLLSDSAVARDGHTIATRGWDLQNYLRNPIVLWAHDSSELPIGRMVEIGAVGDRLMGSVEYPEPDVYPFADTVYRLVKGGYLNAVSVSWLPLEWTFSQDRARPGGIDFKRVELLEVSQVPVPALPSALVDARAAGIDTGPIYQWAEKVLDCGGSVIVPRDELEELRRAAQMPTSRKRTDEERDVIDQSLAYEQQEARKRAGVAKDIPQDVKDSAPAVIDHYEGKMKDKSGDSGRSGPIATLVRGIEDRRATAPAAKKRGLGMAAYLLMLLDQLYDIVNDTKAEAGYEGDDSPVPAKLLAIANDLAAAAQDYITEEIAEEAEGEDVEIGPYYMMAAPDAERRAALGQMLRATTAKTSAPRRDTPILEIGANAARVFAEALDRAGRVLSAENEATLRQAHDGMSRACDMVRSVIDQAAPMPDEPDEPASPDDLTRARQKLAELRQTAA